MCNHVGGDGANASWIPAPEGAVELRRVAKSAQVAGKGGEGCGEGEGVEVTISYGDKPGEEFLFLYGFLPCDNPDDMVVLPLPPITHLGPSNRCANILATFAPFGGDDLRCRSIYTEAGCAFGRAVSA